MEPGATSAPTTPATPGTDRAASAAASHGVASRSPPTLRPPDVTGSHTSPSVTNPRSLWVVNAICRSTAAVPASSPIATTNWATTRTRRSPVPLDRPDDVVAPRSTRVGLKPDRTRAGYAPARAPTKTATPATARTNGTSRSAADSSLVNPALNGCSRASASASATAAARLVSTTDSTTNWAATPHRAAPSAFRTPTSRARRSARAVARLT